MSQVIVKCLIVYWNSVFLLSINSICDKYDVCYINVFNAELNKANSLYSLRDLKIFMQIMVLLHAHYIKCWHLSR